MTQKDTACGTHALIKRLLVALLIAGGATCYSVASQAQAPARPKATPPAQRVAQSVATVNTEESSDQGKFDPSPYYLDDHMHVSIVSRIYSPRAATQTQFSTIRALQEERERRMAPAAPAPSAPNTPSVAPSSGGVSATPLAPAAAQPETTYSGR